MTVRPQYHVACKPPSSNRSKSKSKTNSLRRGDINGEITCDNWRRRAANDNDNNDSAATETDVGRKKSIKNNHIAVGRKITNN